MGIHKLIRVMLSGYGTLIFISLFCWTEASFCEQGKEYHDANLQKCLNCSVCKEGEVVIRPCEIHIDTLCGVLNFKDILNFITPDPTAAQNPHRHHKHSNQHHKNRDEHIVWKYADDVSETDETFAKQPVESEKVAPLISSTEAPFSSAETLIWDWQAIALSTAIFTCILFFLVIALYSLHQAKQWRRLKENFEADVEELSASLMAAAAAQAKNNDVEKGDDYLPQSTKSKIGSDGNYLNRCVYLEQLLNEFSYVKKNVMMSVCNGLNFSASIVYNSPSGDQKHMLYKKMLIKVQVMFRIVVPPCEFFFKMFLEGIRQSDGLLLLMYQTVKRLNATIQVRKDNKNRDSKLGGNVYIAPNLSPSTKP